MPRSLINSVGCRLDDGGIVTHATLTDALDRVTDEVIAGNWRITAIIEREGGFGSTLHCVHVYGIQNGVDVYATIEDATTQNFLDALYINKRYR